MLAVEVRDTLSHGVAIAKSVVFLTFSPLKAPANFTSEALEFDLHGHALRYLVWRVHIVFEFLVVAFALTNHTRHKRLKRPETALPLALSYQEALIEE